MLIQQPTRKLCELCKISLAKPNGKSIHGFTKWHKYCSSCAKATYNKKYGYLLQKKNKCENCGFIPKDKCQLDLVYLDGNKSNKDKKNCKTYCANCSRLFNKEQKLKNKSIYDITVDTDLTL